MSEERNGGNHSGPHAHLSDLANGHQLFPGDPNLQTRESVVEVWKWEIHHGK